MEAILRAAQAGAVGAAFGAGVAWLLSRLLRRQPRWLSLIPIGFAALVVAATRAADPPVSAAVMEKLDQKPVLQALKAHYPKDYARMERDVLRSTSERQVAAAVDATLGIVIVRERAKANPEVAYDLYQMARDEGRLLRGVDARACAALMDGKGDGGRLAPLLTPAMADREQQVVVRLFAQAKTSPEPPARAMTFEELVKLGFEALQTIPEREQDLAVLLLREERDPRTADEARAACDFSLAQADTILSRPRQQAGQLVRGLWAMN